MGMKEWCSEHSIEVDVLRLVVSGVSLVVSFFWGKDLVIDPAWVAIVLCGAPILWDAATGLVLRHDIKADVLVAMAIIASLCLGEWFAAGEVALIMEIGGFLEDFSADRANRGIEALAKLTPRTARVVEDGSEREVPADDVVPGQTVRVLPGEAVPVDGKVLVGETSIDQSVITGESMPVDKLPGDEVFSGTVNQMGSFDMTATRTAADSSFQRLVGMVSSVDADKTRTVRIADRWATRLVAIVMVLAVVTYVVTQDIYRTVTVMIVFCPCAFILATPTAIVAAIGNLAKRGVLVRDGDGLERMADVDTVAFDKTGTVTLGRPSVKMFSAVGDEAETASLAASAESASEHPLARAFTDYADSKGYRRSRPESFSMRIGKGIESVVGGRTVLIGNSRMMEDAGIAVPADAERTSETMYAEGCTVVYIAVDGRYSGLIAFSDTIRDASKATVSSLNSLGVRTVLLTGDNPRAAERMAAEAGIAEVRADCAPEDKVEAIQGLEDSGSKVCMVGDGVNDAPALRKAWVGVAMGATGSDIAADAADMVLVKDGIDSLPHLVSLSRRMMSKIRFNIGFSLVWNFFAVAMSMMALLTPVTGALVHNVGSVFVVANSALLLIYGRRKGREAGPGSEGGPAPAATEPEQA